MKRPVPLRLGGQRRGLSPDAWVRPQRVQRKTSFPRAVELLARTRAGGGDPGRACCEYCGKWLGLGGEVRRRVAGSGRNAVVNGVTNAVVLCTEDRRKAEAGDEEMRVRGWWIRSGNGPEHDPRFVPVVSRSASGELIASWFTESGERTTEEPLPADVKPVTGAEYGEAYRAAERRMAAEARERRG